MKCIACEVTQRNITPTGGLILESAHWTVNHLMGTAPWKGWLVLQPRRHVEALHLLSPDEQQELPIVLGRIDRAVHAALGAEKMYVCLFAEASDCQHIHFHLIPRFADTPARGPAIFQLHADDHPHLYASPGEVEAIAALLRDQLLLDGLCDGG